VKKKENKKKKKKSLEDLYQIQFHISSFPNRTFISPWRDHHSHTHEYPPFRFPDSHHHYDPTSSYYTDAATAAAIDSYAASAGTYSPYMVHHHSPPSASTSSPSIKPENAAAALQSALSLSTPMNVNVSMNINSHSIQYSTGYGSNGNATNFTSSPYETFYNPAASSHYPFANHSPEMKTSRSSAYLPNDSAAKQAMLLSAAAANYDYKDLTKFCDFFPTTSTATATPMNTNEKRS